MSILSIFFRGIFSLGNGSGNNSLSLAFCARVCGGGLRDLHGLGELTALRFLWCVSAHKSYNDHSFVRLFDSYTHEIKFRVLDLCPRTFLFINSSPQHPGGVFQSSRENSRV